MSKRTPRLFRLLQTLHVAASRKLLLSSEVNGNENVHRVWQVFQTEQPASEVSRMPR
jgi:hypothetical protein